MRKHIGRVVTVVATTGAAMLVPAATAFAGPGDGVNISENSKGLPGLNELQTVVGALITVAVIAAIAGIVISAGMWAVGNHSANPQIAGRGKSGVMVAAAAAVLAGGALAIINFFFNIGAGIH